MALYENNSCPVCGKQFQPGDDIVTVSYTHLTLPTTSRV